MAPPERPHGLGQAAERSRHHAQVVVQPRALLALLRVIRARILVRILVRILRHVGTRTALQQRDGAPMSCQRALQIAGDVTQTTQVTVQLRRCWRLVQRALQQSPGLLVSTLPHGRETALVQ